MGLAGGVWGKVRRGEVRPEGGRARRRASGSPRVDGRSLVSRSSGEKDGTDGLGKSDGLPSWGSEVSVVSAHRVAGSWARWLSPLSRASASSVVMGLETVGGRRGERGGVGAPVPGRLYCALGFDSLLLLLLLLLPLLFAEGRVPKLGGVASDAWGRFSALLNALS